jgi:hypothetical protein
MQNSDEEYFKKKYIKYKAKYLALKDLLEGGIPSKYKDKIDKIVNNKCNYEKFIDCSKHFISCNWNFGISKCELRR